MNKYNDSKRQQADFYIPLLNFRNNLEHLFDDAFKKTTLSESNASIPPCNIFETDKAYHIDVKLPGLSSKEVDLSLDNNILTIKGEHVDDNKHSDKHFHSIEFSYESMQRSWELPANVDSEKLSASFDAGILKIELPKKKAESSIKKIKIKE